MLLEQSMYQRITEIIFAKAIQYVKHREDAEDIVQEVLLKLLTRQDNIHPDAIINWAITTTRHECLDFVEKQKKERFVNFDDVEFMIFDKFTSNNMIPDFTLEEENLQKLNPKEKKLLKYFIAEGKNIHKLARRKRTKFENQKRYS